MGRFDGKVAVVTGAGRGIGRSEALLLAAEGAAVVVNDLGGETTGEGADQRPAQQVVDEITAAGGRAAANYDNIATWSGGQALVAQAVDTFGGLDVVINNAGILRDKMSFNMDEAEWDAVIAVHLKGHFTTSRFAASYWRQRVEGHRRPGRRRDREHRARVGPLRQRRSGQLRGGEGRHRVDDDRDGPRARAHRRPRQRDRAGRPHPTHRGGRRRVHGREGRRLRPLRPRERGRDGGVARVARHRRHQRPGLHGRWRQGAAARRLAADHRGRRPTTCGRSTRSTRRATRSLRAPDDACRRSCRRSSSEHAMHLDWGPEVDAFRAELLAFLDEYAPPQTRTRRDFAMGVGASGDELIPQWARDWQATLFDHGWMIPGYPPELGGRNATPIQTLVYLEEMARARHPALAALPRVRDRRAEPARVRHRRAAGARAGRDPRRHDLVHRHERAERGLGPRRAADPRRARRRPLRRQRPEGVDVVRDGVREVLPLRAHRPGRAEAQGHLAADRRHGHARASTSARSPTSPATPTSPRCSSPTSRCRPTNLVGDAATTAGASRRARSRTSAPASGSRASPGSSRRSPASSTSRTGAASRRTRSCGDASREGYQQASSLRALGYKGFTSFAQGSSAPEHSYMKMASSELGKQLYELGMEIQGAVRRGRRRGARRGARPLGARASS